MNFPRGFSSTEENAISIPVGERGHGSSFIARGIAAEPHDGTRTGKEERISVKRILRGAVGLENGETEREFWWGVLGVPFPSSSVNNDGAA